MKNETKTKRIVLLLSILLLLSIVFVVSIRFNEIKNSIDSAYNFCTNNFGWVFVVSNIASLVFSLWIIFGPYKDIKLGGPDSKPTYSNISWLGMLFTSSCGAWLIVYGFLEPIYCSSGIPFTSGANPLEYGQMYAKYHWGPNIWCIYVPATIAIGYLIFNKKEKNANLGSVLSLTNIKNSFFNKIVLPFVDILSICSKILAPVISVGVGMPLLVKIVKCFINVEDNTLEIIILLLWLVSFGVSVYFGIDKGVKKASNINIYLYFAFALFIGCLVGLKDIINSEINSIGLLLNNYIRISTFTNPFGQADFINGWTLSYYACYFVYMPFMGVFNAKISKGRKLRDIAIGQLIICPLGCWIAMATFGNYSIMLQNKGIIDITSYLAVGDEAGAIIDIIKTMPFSKVIMFVLFVVCFVFLATTMNSGVTAAAEATSENSSEENYSPKWLRMLWIVIASIICFILVQFGSVKSIRSLCYIAGLPFAIISILMIIIIIKTLISTK